MNAADVVVVGAGPAGAAAACLLAREGFDVVLLDRATFPRDKACGEFINPAACDLLEDVFGLTRNDLAAAGGSPVSQVRLQLRSSQPLDIPIMGPDGHTASGISLRRTTFDAMLVDRCRQRGVRVCEGYNVRAARRDASWITVSGQNFDFRSRLVLAADGTHSLLARREGLTVPNRRLSSIGIAAHFKGVPVCDASVWMFPSSGDGRMFGFSRQSADSAALSGSIPHRFARSLSADSERFVRTWSAGHPDLAEIVGSALLDGPIRTTTCFGHRLKRPFADRMLFLGDAARFSDPFTGEGIHHAIESGILAARTSVRALATGETCDLSSYELARRELGSRYSLCEIVRAICLRPSLINFIGERLRARPALGQTLVGAIVDLLPSREVLSARFIARALS